MSLLLGAAAHSNGQCESMMRRWWQQRQRKRCIWRGCTYIHTYVYMHVCIAVDGDCVCTNMSHILVECNSCGRYYLSVTAFVFVIKYSIPAFKRSCVCLFVFSYVRVWICVCSFAVLLVCCNLPNWEQIQVYRNINE